MKCTKCGFRFLVEAAPEMYYQLDLPLRCPSGNYGMQTRKQFNPKQKKTKVLRCDSWQFEEFPLTIERTDCQELTLQESTSTLGSGSVPRAVSIVLLDELIESAQPGDDIVVYGLLWRRWKTLRKGQKCEVSIFIEVVSLINFSDPKFQKGSLDNFSSSFKPHLPPVEDRFVNFWKEIDKSQDGRISGRTRILDRICPHLAGIPVAKLSLILALIGGSTSISKDDEESSRNISHIMFLGDPGSGKSQLLKFASRLAQRSVSTSGLGCTAAGLTCAAVREGSEFSLEAGALVLADGGVCCIDEFGCIRKEEKASIHEAMEQQSISVAKAGLIAKLRTRCRVVAAANYIGSITYPSSFSQNQYPIATTNISLSLLSRFDIIVVFLDDGDNDEMIADAVLSAGNQNSIESQNLSGGFAPGPTTEFCSLNEAAECLKEYIAYIRKKFNPVLSEEAQVLISQYYTATRQLTSSGTTVRNLESLVRLSQAHARLLFRDVVTLEDVACVIVAMEVALQGHRVASSSYRSSTDLVMAREPVLPSLLAKDRDHLFTGRVSRVPKTSVFGKPYLHREDITNQADLDAIVRRVQIEVGKISDGNFESGNADQMQDPFYAEMEKRRPKLEPEERQEQFWRENLENSGNFGNPGVAWNPVNKGPGGVKRKSQNIQNFGDWNVADYSAECSDWW
eukprot:GHVP01029656.1.p1 GENE.GHVP01029656.1~~GHVP01029656.1.p1  ORF type:complete len:680 (+),score=111.51 GHVP01029656.1:464-2503(+)